MSEDEAAVVELSAEAPPAAPPRASAPVFGERLAAAQSHQRPKALLIGSGIAAVALIVVGIMAALRYQHRGAGAAPPAAPPAPIAAAPVAAPKPDTAAHRRDSIAAALAAMGFVRVIGDIPEGSVLYLDTLQVTGSIFPAHPGTYDLEIQTDDFEPWEKHVTVRAGDTTKVRVELVLKSDSTEKSDSTQH
ncbi:MAG TPA: PEGA domain-containing protein [Gemmatimonadales bacterium]|jgi:hypothetical protein